jgi:hypothetical protein
MWVNAEPKFEAFRVQNSNEITKNNVVVVISNVFAFFCAKVVLNLSMLQALLCEIWITLLQINR